jgi:hypothetical protein
MRELNALGIETEIFKPPNSTEEKSNEGEEKSNGDEDNQEETIPTEIYSAITSYLGELTINF